VPLWIADYVLGHYGTGAVMAVPAHDERDFAFAKRYNLPIKQVIISQKSSEDHLQDQLPLIASDGILTSVDEYFGVPFGKDTMSVHCAIARNIFAEKAEAERFGHKKVNYKLRDWLFSRQRYWGEPIPLIHLAIEDVKKLPHIANIVEATDMNLAYILKRNPIE